MTIENEQCPICVSSGRKIFNLDFYITDGSISTPVYYCKNCGIFWRIFKDPSIMNDHFKIASYTNFEREECFKNMRYKFFQQILGLIEKYHSKNSAKVLLDFGCSYGHLIDIANCSGYKCIGIELVDHLREKLAHRHEIYKTLDFIKSNSIDAITSIDSLYYVNEPYAIMNDFSRVLKDNGLLIVRITNRNYFIKMMLLFRKTITPQIFGDNIISFSHKSIKFIARKTKFRIEKIIYQEDKPKKKKLFLKIGYGLFSYISRLTGIKLTPGLIYVLRKNRDG